ncbi:thiamine diphosphate-binding protein [Macrolepiota fuliginosa MF-IS2]|uniref:assimilatory sulfite reductase (NADPH) n=1 Tax=Macrolepiota fuliginosa MF-IS2 TaxID=1400762 RepID=A0A9P6BZQ9_9AGAR|nr:thiamine diphosphate-binding protein [Macrolepiota fuliginosa MF-IS2]
MALDQALAAVARIAYLTSDVIVDSQPPFPATSAFAQQYASLTGTSTNIPRVVPAPFGADPGSTILRNPANLTSFTATSNTQVSTRLVLHLAELSSRPVVLHLAVHDDLSDVLLLRSAVPWFLLSSTTQQAHDNALLAARLARLERKPVVHVFYSSHDDEPLDAFPEDKILPFLLAAKHPASPSSASGHVTLEDTTDGRSVIDDPAVTVLFKAYQAVAAETLSHIRRPLRDFVVRGSSEPQTVIFTVGRQDISVAAEGVSFVALSLLNPIPPSRLLSAIPASVQRVIVLEQVYRWTTKWTPLYLEVVSALQHRSSEHRPIVLSGILGDVSDITLPDIHRLVESSSSARLQLGSLPSAFSATSVPVVPKYESAYTKILSHVFGDRLQVANSPSLVASQGQIATAPEFALGRVRGQIDARGDLVSAVEELLRSERIGSDLHALLSKWLLSKDDGVKSKKLARDITTSLESTVVDHPAAAKILSLQSHLPATSRWIIGSDAWSYDLGASGLHHAIASGLNVNILIIDTLPYTARNSADPHRRKHDVGLYAMNHGDVYVASVAVFSSYSQVLQSLMEADRFNGPSVVLAYLPHRSEESPALEVLKETKLAVDAGYWPLYRWDPSKEHDGKEPFSLDSDAVKNDLKQFLDRQNHLSQLVRSTPQIAAELVSNLGDTVKEARKQRAQQSYNDLLSSIDAPPLLILYASDGGAAEKKAKRLAGRAKARGLSTTISTLDSVPLETLTKEEYVVFVSSTAGQGEPPQNGRTFFKAVNAAATRGDRVFNRLKFSVFGMGDSHYWPRPEDAHYYNKPSKDLDARLEKLGVIKRHLKPAIQDINRVLLDTLAACGDVNRNVICSSIPTMSKLHAQVYEFAKEISSHLIPRTTAYHEIWLDKKLVAGEALKDFEPLYGEFYLPRKFKIAVAVPPTNDIDVFANDVGFIAIVDKDGELEGFNVAIGGGMGVTHGNKKTYPRTGSIIGFCTVEQGKYVAEKIMLVQRDHGNRVDRKNARLKYTIDRMGLDVYKAEVEKLLGYPLEPSRPYTFDRNIDDFGWHVGQDGKHHFLMFIENGRVQDEPGREFKTGLREIAKVLKGSFRLTANQHLMISDIPPEDLDVIKNLLVKYQLDNLNYSGLRLSSSACVAFPTCGLAMAESERYLPLLIDKVEKLCEENGLRNDSIVMRMTGCPNGCARPYVAEVAFVGKAPGTYSMLLGGGYYGQRLNKIYRESVTEPEILAILRPMIERYAKERLPEERFGDFTIRAGYIAPTTEGKAWYDRMGGEGAYAESAVIAVA